MARTLDQIMSELGTQFDPQVANIRKRQEMIPGQIQSEEQGLQARQQQAFGDIMSGARRRGLGFSGIPLSEQAQYTATELLPALARLKQSGREQAMSLEDAILGINERRGTLAQQLFQQDQQRDLQERQFQEQIRQYNEDLAFRRQQAAQAAAAARGGSGGATPSFSVPSGGAPQQSQNAFYRLKDQRNPGAGFAFADANGRAISALEYSRMTGTPFNELVKRMASAGDPGARSLLPFATSSGVAQIYNPQLSNLVRAFTWG